MAEHDFNKYPELTNAQMADLEFQSPHKQITEDFRAIVIKVIDGDTIRLRTDFRDFDFPMRFLDIDAPEMNAGGGEAKDWLIGRILNEKVNIIINKNNRVDKYGRLLGYVFKAGMNVGNEALRLGLVLPFTSRNEGKLPNLGKMFALRQWL